MPVIVVLAIMFRSFGFIASKTLIIWLSNLSILSVPDDDYSRNVSCALNWITALLLCSRDKELGGGGGSYWFTPVRSFVRPSGYRYMVCPAISSYSFGATALICCRMFIHIMEVCMSTGFWFSSNILKMTGSWTLVIFFVLAAYREHGLSDTYIHILVMLDISFKHIYSIKIQTLKI
jgi:hypothetical protein